MGWTTGIQFLAETRDYYLLHKVQTNSGAPLASYTMGTVTVMVTEG
jgi:hypothetical protein